jgi:hypothetical protein
MTTSAPVTIRYATPSDADALTDLAALDSTRVPGGDVLVARVGRELWAAVSLDDLHAVADPFRPSGDVAHLLRERAKWLRRQVREARATTGMGRVVFR